MCFRSPTTYPNFSPDPKLYFCISSPFYLRVSLPSDPRKQSSQIKVNLNLVIGRFKPKLTVLYVEFLCNFYVLRVLWHVLYDGKWWQNWKFIDIVRLKSVMLVNIGLYSENYQSIIRSSLSSHSIIFFLLLTNLIKIFLQCGKIWWLCLAKHLFQAYNPRFYLK